MLDLGIKGKYRLIERLRLFFVVGIGGIMANSYLMVIYTKAIYQGPLKAGCVPFMNCHSCPSSIMSCPIGILQHFASIRKFPFFLAGFLGLTGLTFGRAACGWLCPCGFFQDMMYRINSYKMSIHPVFSKLKYLSLVFLVILMPYLTEIHWFSSICPWGTLTAGIPWVVWNPIDPAFDTNVIEHGAIGWFFVTKVVILIFFLLLFVITKRPFCRTLCPLGAIYSLFNRFSFMQVTYRKDGCNGCTHCKDVCPVDNSISDVNRGSECIRCLKCTSCKNIKLSWTFIK